MSHLQKCAFSLVRFGLNKELLTSKNLCWKSTELSLLAHTQKIKSWHWANFSSVFANNELNKWALPSDVLHEGEREAKGNIVFLQPIPSIPSTRITVWFLLLLVRLCFPQMDRAALTLMKKERSCFFPSAPASLFLTCCLLAAPCSGCAV